MRIFFPIELGPGSLAMPRSGTTTDFDVQSNRRPKCNEETRLVSEEGQRKRESRECVLARHHITSSVGASVR